MLTAIVPSAVMLSVIVLNVIVLVVIILDDVSSGPALTHKQYN